MLVARTRLCRVQLTKSFGALPPGKSYKHGQKLIRMSHRRRKAATFGLS